MTVYFNVQNTAIKCLKGCSLTFKSIILPIANGVVTRKINKAFSAPKPIGDLLEAKHLGILNLSVMTTWAEEQYLLFAVTPQFRGFNKRNPTMADVCTALEPEVTALIEQMETEMTLML
jgi:hypothetical protein